MVLGVVSWATLVLLCAGATGILSWLPILLAAAGLGTGVLAATHPLPRDATPDILGAIFMSFSVLAIWLLALVLL